MFDNVMEGGTKNGPTTEGNRVLQAVTFQDDSIEVASFTHLQLVPKRKSGSPGKRDGTSDDDSFGGNEDSILSEGGYTTAAGSTNTARNQQKEKSTASWYRRLLMLLTATLIGFFVSGVVFYATRLAEVESFEQGFAELGNQILETVNDDLAKKLLALDSLSIAFTSHNSIHAQATPPSGLWPTTTLPDFEARATNALAAADSMSLVFAPLVHNGTMDIWNEFLLSNTGEWELETPSSPTLVEEERLGIQEPPPSTTMSQPSLLNDPETSFRVWQHYPRSSGLINANLLAVLSPSLLAFLGNREAIIGETFEAADPAKDKMSSASPLHQYLSTLRLSIKEQGTQSPRLGGDEMQRTLISNIYYPIFDSLIAPGAGTAQQVNSRSLVGLLTMDIVWNDFFSGIDSIGIDDEVICVLRNQCGQIYTFRVQHDRVIDTIQGDSHPTKYDDLVVGMRLDKIEVSKKSPGNFFQSQLDDFCVYELRVYPSISLEEQYLTYKPALYTASTAFCFIIIFLLSLAYERRVAHVHESAIQYREVVTNLFPPAVRLRMFRKEEQEPRKNRKKRRRLRNRDSAAISQKSSTLVEGKWNLYSNTNTPGTSPSSDPRNAMTLVSSKPIADYFQESTVLFADIAGFTNWSSQRNPEHVFTLLQTLFNTFDGIAKKCRVFKVETIGDCYMAVTGVPEPQADHAVRMTKFARVCLHRVKPLLERLEATLGKGTQDLAIRVGLHSGPVTAGVLQGEKSRFQLFGDTVNTASRMESNGEPGRIHISRATADLLVQAKKDHWLEKRSDPIHAKGKGLMETYWIRRSSSRHRSGGQQSKAKVPSEFHESADFSDSDFMSDSEVLFSSFNTSVTSRLTDADDKTWNGFSSRGSGLTLDDNKDIAEARANQNTETVFANANSDNLYRFAFIED